MVARGARLLEAPIRPLTGAQLITFKLQLRLPDIDERPKFVNVGVAVVEKGVECMDVQRCSGGFCPKCFGRIEKVVVAINEDAR